MINYFTEKIKFNLTKKNRTTKWISDSISEELKLIGELNFIFCSDNYLLEINKQYLKHDYYTDVITFDYSEGPSISGDVFISIEQVEINAKTYSTEPGDELRRVMIHGVIHLIGYKDETDEERNTMRQMENEALHLWLKMV